MNIKKSEKTYYVRKKILIVVDRTSTGVMLLGLGYLAAHNHPNVPIILIICFVLIGAITKVILHKKANGHSGCTPNDDKQTNNTSR